MPRLHAGNYAELLEPVQIPGGDQLDVHQLVPGVARAVDLAGAGDGVQGHMDAAVTDSVDQDLEMAGAQLTDQIGERLRVVEGAAAGGGLVGIGLEQRCCMVPYDVVDVELHRGHPQPVVIVTAPGRLEFLQLADASGRGVEKGSDQTAGQGLVIACPLVQAGHPGRSEVPPQ